jgi:AcrR family transcriptional regulator
MTKGARGVGRPRALTLSQVIDAATEVGLADLSISRVALRLGVGLGTIYTYVDSLDALRRLVGVALARRPALEDSGQHWAEIVRATAAQGFDLLSREPELLAQVVAGAIGPAEGFAEMEAFLAMLAARGFAVDKAFELYRATGQIAAGAAVSAAMVGMWARQGTPRRAKLAHAFADAAPDAFPHVRMLGDALHDEARYLDYRPALERLLAQVAAERGETLPPTLSER